MKYHINTSSKKRNIDPIILKKTLKIFNKPLLSIPLLRSAATEKQRNRYFFKQHSPIQVNSLKRPFQMAHKNICAVVSCNFIFVVYV